MNSEIHGFRRFHRTQRHAPLPVLSGQPSRRLLARAWQAAAAKPTTPRPADDTRPLSDHPLARSARMGRVEAVLLLAREPLNSRRLSQLANLTDGTEARTLTRKLNRIYDTSGRSFRIEEVAGGFQMLSRAKFAPWLRRGRTRGDEVRLSAPAMETLSVVAYRQPVMRAEVESIRGVQCGEILRQLMERGLVRIVGRADELGRPFLYGTSKRFLQVFGLRHLDELPRADILRKAEVTSIVPVVSSSAGKTADSSADQEQESSDMLIAPSRFGQDTLASTDDSELISRGPTGQRQPSTAAVFEEEVDDEDDEEDDDFDFDDDEEDDEDLEDDEEFEDDDLEDDEWEEVDDEDEDEDDDEEWDEEDEEEWADDDWDDEDEDEDDEEEEEEEDEL